MAVRQAVERGGRQGSAMMAVSKNGRRLFRRPTTLRLAVLALPIMAAVAAPETTHARYAPVVFVGNENVDLKWVPAPWLYKAYVIKRDGQQIARITDPDLGFYRDSTVSKGQTYVYDFCYVSQPQGGQEELNCSDQQRPITVGEVGGELYQDLTWNAGVYKFGPIRSYVRVWEGATLKIEGSTIELPSGTSYTGQILSEGSESGGTGVPGGIIQISGATIPAKVKVTFAAAGQNYLVGSTVTGDPSQENTILVTHDAEVLIKNNRFDGVGFYLTKSAHAQIEGNRIEFGRIALTRLGVGVPVATITRNVFVNVLPFSSGANMAINQTYGAAFITDNSFTGQIDLSPSARPRAIVLAPWSEAYASAEITGNSFSYFSETITLLERTSATVLDNSFNGSRTCVNMRNSEATIIDNTFVDCAIGIDMSGESSAVIRQNVFTGDVTLQPQQGSAIVAWDKSRLIVDKNRIAGLAGGIHFTQTVSGSATDNVVTDGGSGISIGGGDVTVEGNTLMRNRTGLSYFREGGAFRDNCIANNWEEGLDTISYHVDARYNWWGAVNGPQHWEKNPEGSGDRIDGTNVDFDPWLTTDNCAEPAVPPLCGNGRLDPGEECDDGGANSDTRPNACRSTCKLPTCGDTVIDDAEPYFEDCDDGNTVDGDGCPANCKLEITLTPHLIMGLGVCGSAEREIQVRNSLDQDIAGHADVTYAWIGNGLAEDVLAEFLAQISAELSGGAITLQIAGISVRQDQNANKAFVQFHSNGINVLQAKRTTPQGDTLSNYALVFAADGDELVKATLEITPWSLGSLPLKTLDWVLSQVFDTTINPPMILFTKGPSCTLAIDDFIGQDGIVGVRSLKFEFLGGTLGEFEFVAALARLVQLTVHGMTGGITAVAPAIEVLAAALSRPAAEVLASQLLDFEVSSLAATNSGKAGTDPVTSDGIITVKDELTLTPPFLKGVVTALKPGISAVQATFDMQDYCLGKASDVMLVLVGPLLEAVEIRNEAEKVEDPMDLYVGQERYPHAVGTFNFLGQPTAISFDAIGLQGSDLERLVRQWIPWALDLGVPVEIIVPSNATLDTRKLYPLGDFYFGLKLNWTPLSSRVTFNEMRLQLRLPEWIPLITTWTLDTKGGPAVVSLNESLLWDEVTIKGLQPGQNTLWVQGCVPFMTGPDVKDDNEVRVLEGTPPPAATPTVTATRTPTPSVTTTPTRTRTPTASSTPTSSRTPTPTPSVTPSATRTPSSSPTATRTGTATVTPSRTPTGTTTATASATPTATPTSTPTAGRPNCEFLITVIKFEDLDGDGVRDAGEPGLDGWGFDLLDGSGTTRRTGLTINGGVWSWSVVVDLNWKGLEVREHVRPGWIPTTDDREVISAEELEGLIRICDDPPLVYDIPFGNRRVPTPGGTATATPTVTGGTPSNQTPTATRTPTATQTRTPTPTRTATPTPTVQPIVVRVLPPYARQGTTGLELTIKGANFAPGAVVSFQPSAGITLIPAPPPNFGYVGPTELRQTIDIASDALVGEREVHVTNLDGRSGGIRPHNLFLITVADPGPDAGDCNRDGVVMAAEVGWALPLIFDPGAMAQCAEHDRNSDGQVTAAELVASVLRYLQPPSPSASPTAALLTATPTRTPTQTPTAALLPTVTPSRTPTRTPTPAPTLTPVPTVTPSRTPTMTPSGAPSRTPTPTPTATPWQGPLFCSTPTGGLPIPDGDTEVGAHDSMLLLVSGKIVDLRVHGNIQHPYVGDLFAGLVHVETGTSVVLLDYPGYPASAGGCPRPNVTCVFDDAATQPAEAMCNSTAPAISGRVVAAEPLSAFVGEYASGTWQLWLWDAVSGDTGRLISWCLELQ